VAEADTTPIDIAALDAKYAEERAKRLRADANDQYVELRDVDWLNADPYADPDFTRDPIVEDLDVLIVGGGFAGLLAACRLRQHGVTGSIRIVEKGGDFGGAWYWNRYPGASCDIESYIYMPMLEETGYIPTERYARAAEIFAYARRLGEQYDLYRDALFQTEVKGADWDATCNRWIVSTSRGDRIAARFLISCAGLLTNARLPGIPGIESFAGHSFHTSRWDYRYTGGDADGDLTGLADKRVGIIGTGSTGLQAIPVLARYAKELYVFQRTPSAVEVRGNRPTDPEWANSLQPGWQRERIENFTNATTGVPVAVDMVNDAWTDVARIFLGNADGKPIDPGELRLAEMKKMERIRQRVASTVRDPATAEALKPWYYYMCKRPGFHDEYLDAFNRPNVTLVDTAGKGVERITPKGAVVAGREYPLDCLIYATGFDWLAQYDRHSGIQVRGIDGVSLSEHWADGARTLFGMQTRGFPNFFLMSLIQAAASFNYFHGADEQVKHIAHIVAACLDRGVATVQPSEQAENAWVDEVMASAGPRRAFLESCTPGYYNFEGKRDRANELNDFYGGAPTEYLRRLVEWRAGGDLPGLELD
jgi:cyclohexanone monooxygenase